MFNVLPYRELRRGSPAFTLLELLVVIAILGLVAAISLPNMKGLTHASKLSAAKRQLVDDLAYARQRAIKDRTTVHVLFLPPSITNITLSAFSPDDQPLARRLQGGAFTTYALFAERSVGDQPGRKQSRYIRDWKTLPDGVMFATSQFIAVPDQLNVLWNGFTSTNRPFEYHNFPFPDEDGLTNYLPHIAFNPQGQLSYVNTSSFYDTYIWLSRGSILVPRNANGDVLDVDVRENPEDSALNANRSQHRVRLDGFTGRPRKEDKELQ